MSFPSCSVLLHLACLFTTGTINAFGQLMVESKDALKGQSMYVISSYVKVFHFLTGMQVGH
jgi:hypothetical protein